MTTTTKPKHTQGEWYVEGDKWLAVDTGEGRGEGKATYLAELLGATLADYALLCAAPKLLAAAERFNAIVLAIVGAQQISFDQAIELTQSQGDLLAAIAEARGEPPPEVERGVGEVKEELCPLCGAKNIDCKMCKGTGVVRWQKVADEPKGKVNA